jgi:hypothetical protein
MREKLEWFVAILGCMLAPGTGAAIGLLLWL